MPSSWLTLAICLACCWGTSQLPDGVQRRFRALLLDSCLPFEEAKSAAEKFSTSRWPATADRLAALESQFQSERAAWAAELRRRELAIARLSAGLQIEQQLEASPFPVASSEALIEYDPVSAGVVSPEQLRFLQRELLIRSDELTDGERDSLVIQAVEPENVENTSRPAELILDQGETTGFKPEQPVYAGRCVVGTLADVGHWISRVRLLTDPEYRGRARILREVEDGFSYGPEGILEGTGETFCRLRYLSRTESVRVGDGVYTSGPVPMYYGRIVRAELDEHAPEWDVWVQPAAAVEHLQSVQVLRRTVNPLRRLTN